MENQDFRKKLIEVRKARGLTQEDVAKMCKITVRTIQRIESGKVIPRAYTIKAISDNIGISFFETSNGDSRNEGKQSNRKNQSFYWYLKDLFNLKTNPMKKISILTTPFLIIGFALFFILNSEANAQNNHSDSSLNNYSFDLYHETKVESDNLLLSPVSTYYALLIAYEGSKKKTKQEFEKVLYLNKSGSLYSDYLYSIVNKSDSCSNLKISNAIWLDNSLVVEGEFSKTVSDKYYSDFEHTDFANTKSAVSDINEWVSEKTNHKIDKIVKDSDITPETKLLISNAVFFKGEWLIKFNIKKTNPAPFFTSADNQYKVDFMNMTESLQYFENDEYQFISKPYRNSDLSFCIILPKKLFGIEEIEKKMNPDFLNEILDSTYYIKTALSIPKLKLELSYELSDALKRTGLNTAFTNEADFSGITKDAPLQFSKVLHKTYIELDEEKTEAAAATASTVRITGLPSYKIFKADHPFVFFVIDNQSKAILFMGRYVKPTNGEKIKGENLAKNLETRKQEKFEVGNSNNRLLYVVDKKIISQDEFDQINPEDIESIKVLKKKKDISKYSTGNFGGALVITLKKKKDWRNDE